MEEVTTSVPTWQYSSSKLLTWKPDGKLSWSKMGLYEEPHQQNLHHHHYHYHYYQCSAACSCPSNALSPSTAQQAEADPSQTASSYNHIHTHVPSHPKAHTHCPLPPQEHTYIAPCPIEHTYHSPTSDLLTTHTHSHIPPFTEYLTKHPHTTLSAERARTPAVSRSQKSSPCDTDLYATPQLHGKKPKKTKPLISKPYPPFPSPSAPPYILCQHCFKVLSLPLSPPLRLLTGAPVLKLKCAFCTRISLFSTRCDTDGEFQFKVDVRTFDVDAHSCDASSKDDDCLLGLKKNSMNVHVPANCKSMDGCGREQHTHVPIIDTLADKEQEIVDANALFEDTLTESRTQGNYSSPQPSLKLNPEFAGFSSVQDWVNSIEQESFLYCPTPLLGTAFGSDLQLQAPIDWEIYDEEHRGDMFSLPVAGSPLHEHFGYKSPLELLNKTPSWDDEIKIPWDTTSSASTSAMSANTFTPPGFENADRSKYKNGCKRVSVKQGLENSVKGSTDVEPSNQVFLANVFRKGIKGLVEGKSLSVSSPKSRVIVNGHMLSQPALKRAEERAGKLRPGTYWYDSKAGFWGIIGGPCLGVLPPFIEELQYPISRDCSNGDTQIIVNGRELHHKDLTVLALRGLSRKPGMAYAIGFDGIVVEESSGRELKRLGKLAPTVERKGKGFGMYMAKQ